MKQTRTKSHYEKYQIIRSSDQLNQNNQINNNLTKNVRSEEMGQKSQIAQINLKHQIKIQII